jgi:hypothetical protein
MRFIHRRGIFKAAVLLLLARAPFTKAGPCLAEPSLHGEGIDIASYFPEKGMFEERGRLFVKLTSSPAPWLYLHASAYAEFLLRSRAGEGRAGNLRMHETYVGLRGGRFDIRAGYLNTVWGVLDEIQPNDVVNPIDVSRFFFEGRNEARLPIPLVSARLYLPADLRVEFVGIPFFEKGVFDQLDEATSPFNIASDQIPPGFGVKEELPARTWRNVEYGGRISGTLRQIDFDLYTFRGRKDFPAYAFPYLAIPLPTYLAAYFPSFTLLGADIETTLRRWGLRSEGAVTLDDAFQHPAGFGVVRGRSIQVGVGADRPIGRHTLNLDAVYLRRIADGDFVESPEELSLVMGLELTSRYELKKGHVFIVYDPIDGTLFLRAKGGINLFHNFWLDISSGTFLGSGNGLVGRFEDDDFLLLSGTYSF